MTPVKLDPFPKLPNDVFYRVGMGHYEDLAHQRREAHSALFELAGRNALQLEYDGKGCPHLVLQPNIYVSVSHCRGAVAAAVGRGRKVGIDVECRRKVSPDLVKRVCTEEEQAWIASQPDTEMAFLELWTRKEAVLKCRGTGIQGFGSMLHALIDPTIEVKSMKQSLFGLVVSVAYTA